MEERSERHGKEVADFRGVEDWVNSVVRDKQYDTKCKLRRRAITDGVTNSPFPVRNRSRVVKHRTRSLSIGSPIFVSVLDLLPHFVRKSESPLRTLLSAIVSVAGSI